MADGAVYRGYTQTELNAQYNPRLTEPNFQAYFDRWGKQGAKARRARSVKRDVSYGRGKTDKLDIFVPPGKGPHPVLIYIHGGWWRAFSKNDRAFLAPAMNAAGIMMVAIDYALCPAVAIDELVAQCRRAVVWVDRNIKKHGGDPKRIYVAGESAGAHLTAMIAQTDWRAEGVSPAPVVRAALAVSGVYDLTPFPHTFIQPDVRLTSDQVARNSPVQHAWKFPTQLTLAVGLGESDEFKRQLDEYSNALAKAGVRHDVVRVGGRNHYSILDCLTDPRNMLYHALMRMMRP